MDTVISFVLTHKEAIGTAAGLLWEIVVRLKPTWKDYSLVNKFKRFFDMIPNKTPDGDTHK